MQLVGFAVSFGVVTLLFAMMFKWLPDARIGWRDVWIGAIATAALFEIGKFMVALYIGKLGLESTYGAAASIVIVLIWVYYSAQIFFLGAEFTRAYAQVYGSRPCDYTNHEVKLVASIDHPEKPLEGTNVIVKP